jgi:hypothetical protein
VTEARPVRLAAFGLLAALAALVAPGCGGGPAVTGSSSPSTPSGIPGTSAPPSRPGRLTIGRAPFGLPSAVQRAVAIVDGGMLVVAGGLDASDASTDEIVGLDVSSGHATALGTMPNRFHDAAGAFIGGRMFVFGGGVGGTSSDAVQRFDPAGGAGQVVAHLPTALSDVSAGTVGGETYLVGGFDGVTAQRSILGTIDGMSFERVGSLPRGLRYTAVTGAGGRLIIAGGETPSGPVSSVLAFDPRTSKVTRIANLPAPVGHAAAFTLGGWVFVAGGLDAAGHAVRTITAIDPATGATVSAGRLPAPLSDAAVTQSGDRAWLAGGWNGAALSEVLEAQVRPAS